MTDGRPVIPPSVATNVTHLLWVGRWIEVVSTPDGWRFKRTQDALDWLRAE